MQEMRGSWQLAMEISETGRQRQKSERRENRDEQRRVRDGMEIGQR